jgi:hypothetical protein
VPSLLPLLLLPNLCSELRASSSIPRARARRCAAA